MASLSFTSISFILILIATFILFWSVKSATLRSFILSLGSFAFYSLAGWQMPLLLFCMIAITLLCGNYIILNKAKSKFLYIFGLFFDLAILAICKYCDFFIENINAAIHLLGFRSDIGLIRLLMPAGLSFYTFSMVSHLIDCKRGRFEGNTISPFSFFAFVSFFPHLIAGPIDRSRLILPQLSQLQTFRFETAREGCWQILNGLFKKLVVADLCAYTVNSAWNHLETQSTLSLIIVAFLYSMQIYCDFSGFTDMALGIGKLFGLRLMDNFKYPYFAQSISMFWRRWHISLTSWLTEYIYIPLGGNRRGIARTMLNTVIVFTLCGFWHGANWGYVLWGLVCGLMFIPNIIHKSIGINNRGSLPLMVKALKALIVFSLITFTWIIFRGAQALSDDTVLFFKQLIFNHSIDLDLPILKIVLCLSALVLTVEFIARRYAFALGALINWPQILRWAVYILIFVSIWYAYLISPSEASTDVFIYQNF